MSLYCHRPVSHRPRDRPGSVCALPGPASKPLQSRGLRIADTSLQPLLSPVNHRCADRHPSRPSSGSDTCTHASLATAGSIQPSISTTRGTGIAVETFTVRCLSSWLVPPWGRRRRAQGSTTRRQGLNQRHAPGDSGRHRRQDRSAQLRRSRYRGSHAGAKRTSGKPGETPPARAGVPNCENKVLKTSARSVARK